MNVDFKYYTERSLRTCNYYNEIKKHNDNPYLIEELDYKRMNNNAMGIGGESGEIIDILKKHLHQGKNLDKEHLKEEIGDLFWYLSNLINQMGFDLNEILEENIKKLENRYLNC
jgi:NTP pyrophosphatase (non-canonical NTP hydrolase)